MILVATVHGFVALNPYPNRRPAQFARRGFEKWLGSFASNRGHDCHQHIALVRGKPLSYAMRMPCFLFLQREVWAYVEIEGPRKHGFPVGLPLN